MDLKKKLALQPEVKINEQHLAATIEASRCAYERRMPAQKRNFRNLMIRLLGFRGGQALVRQFILFLGMWAAVYAFTGETIYALNRWNLSLVLCMMAVCSGMYGFSYVNKSRRYGMLELEMSMVHSVSSIMAARMLTTGLWNLFFMAAAAGIINMQMKVNFLHLLLYAAVPYLASWTGSLFLCRMVKSQEMAVECAALGTVLLLALVLMRIKIPEVYSEAMAANWAAVGLLLAAVLVWQMNNMKKNEAMAELYLGEN